MPPNDNRPREWLPKGGKCDNSNSARNVVPLFPERNISSPWDSLTVELIMAKHRAGELDPRLLRALAELAMGLHP